MKATVQFIGSKRHTDPTISVYQVRPQYRHQLLCLWGQTPIQTPPTLFMGSEPDTDTTYSVYGVRPRY